MKELTEWSPQREVSKIWIYAGISIEDRGQEMSNIWALYCDRVQANLGTRRVCFVAHYERKFPIFNFLSSIRFDFLRIPFAPWVVGVSGMSVTIWIGVIRYIASYCFLHAPSGKYLSWKYRKPPSTLDNTDETFTWAVCGLNQSGNLLTGGVNTLSVVPFRE